jgi:CubicO group peptidase (beta-lactamase class C family)
MHRITAALLLALPQLVTAEAPRSTIAAALQPFVDDHVLAGAVTIVADKEKVLDLTTVGWANIAGKKPMQADSVMWIASMSKAITGAAVMALVDDGKLSPEDPVKKFIPEFSSQRVISEQDDAHTLLVPAAKAITVQDTLCHTAGLPFKSGIEQPTLDMVPLRVAVLSHASAPLIHQPDSKYQYSNAGINTAGHVIEIVSGQSFEDFLDQRILKPLGMKDTSFWPTDEQVSRLALSYKANANKTDLEATPIVQLHYPLQDRQRQPMPGGGLFSTAADVTAFCQMLLNKGSHKGQRILSEKAVETMTSRQTPAELKESYGFGLQVQQDGYGHGGAHSTNMTVNTKEGLVMILMVQHAGWRNDSGKQVLPTFQKAALAEFGKR